MLRRLDRRLTALIACYPEIAKRPTVFVTALGGALIATQVMLFPNALLEQTSLGRTMPFAGELMWAILSAAGGWITVVGLLRGSRQLEAAGSAALAFVWAIDALAVFSYRGYAAGSITGGMLATLSIGYFARLIVLLWLSRKEREIAEDLNA